VAQMMDQDLLARLEELHRAVLRYESIAKQRLGFLETIHYKGVAFDVSSEFVIADLSPLAFFNLVEYIDTHDATGAAARLYERISPLLSCKHRWIEPTMPLDQDGRLITHESLRAFGHVLVCECCTACIAKTLGANLPTIGRSTDPLL